MLLVTHHLSYVAYLSHTTLSHTHTHLCQPPSFTHHLSHTYLSTTIFHTSSFPHHLSHTISHTHLCQPPSFTHHLFAHTIFHTSSLPTIFVNHHLSHTIFHTPSFTHIFVNNHLSHTIFYTHHLSHTISHTPSWRHPPSFHVAGAWHLWLWAGSGGALGPVLVAGDAAALCVAGVALGDILRGRRGTYGAGLALVAHLGPFWSPVTPRHFAWQAWHLATLVSRGRHGTWRQPPSFCVAGVALMALGWLWWRAWARFGRRWRRGTLRGRRGTSRHPCSFHVEGVALGDNHLRFAWQAWHLWHWAGSGGALGPVLVAGGAAALCVAGVALRDIHVRFTWKAWHLATTTFVLRGRRGTYGTGLALVARLGPFWSPVTPRHFRWQAWHLVTSTFVSRGRCGTWRHLPSFCVAGVAPSFTHPLSHTIFSHPTLSPTIFHAPSFTHHFATHHL